jgi:hypothetical protein
MSKKFDEEYLNKVAAVSNQMLAAGLKIPAPFDHHKEARPRTQQQEDEFLKISVNKPGSAYHNAGYWKKFWVAPNEKGKATLYGQLDAVGDISDANSPVYKVTKANEEVSVSITDSFEDGLGRTWTDGLLHVAIVHHAVVPDQSPFEDGTTVVNMSMVENEEPSGDSTSLVEEIKAALKRVKINLPGSTTAATFMRDLLVATLQLPESSADDLQPVPIYMSIGDNDMKMTQAQAEALVATKSVNPATTKPWTMEDFGFTTTPAGTPSTTELSTLKAQVAEKDQELLGMKGILSAFKAKFVADTQAAIQQRISALVRTGVVTKEYADANLVPKVEFQMSVVGGAIADHPLTMVLSTLEAMPPIHKPSPAGQFPGVVEPNGWDDSSLDVDDEAMEKALSSLAKDGYL